MSDTPKPGWLSFSIRDLLWFTTVVAVVLWALYAHLGTSGRFAMQHDPAQYQTYILDTAKGRCWIRASDGSWIDATPPALKK